MAQNKRRTTKTKLTDAEYYNEVFDAINGDIYEVACILRALHLAMEGGRVDEIPDKDMLPHLVLNSAFKLEKAVERINNLS
jgi:hypothetical protein